MTSPAAAPVLPGRGRVGRLTRRIGSWGYGPPRRVLSDRVTGWLWPIAVTLLAFVLRVWNLRYPNKLLFDETYYAKDAWSLLHFGIAIDYHEDANTRIQAGDLHNLWTGDPTWIVHPDGSKWLIAIGESIFGMNSFGWRISAAVVGSLTVLVLARLVRRLTGSTTIGCLAGLLMCFDGIAFTMSRLALVDGFLAFWLVCATACLVADRDWIAARLDRYRLFRPWQIGAGICFGMACGCKWNGVFVLAAFGLTVVVWEVVARRRAWRDMELVRPSRKPGWIRTTLAVGVPAFVVLVGLTFVVYLANWTGFLVHHREFEARFGHGNGYGRVWGSYVNRTPHGFWQNAHDALISLWRFHQMTYHFDTDGLKTATHPYQSNPLGWLVLERPVGVDAVNDLPASSCGAPAGSSCMRQVLIIGNPIVWWTGALALVAALVAWLRTRSWRWSIPVVGLAATWLPWFRYDDRPIFLYYAVSILPFTIIAICLVAHSLWKVADTPRSRYAVWLLGGVYVTAVIATFWYFHPIWTDKLISYDDWYGHMWFRSWI